MITASNRYSLAKSKASAGAATFCWRYRLLAALRILAALKVARQQGLVTVGFTGAKGAGMAASCDHLLVAPSDDMAVIQQIYMAFAHGICDVVEQALTQKTASLT